jgi:hypothetical protein
VIPVVGSCDGEDFSNPIQLICGNLLLRGNSTKNNVRVSPTMDWGETQLEGFESGRGMVGEEKSSAGFGSRCCGLCDWIHLCFRGQLEWCEGANAFLGKENSYSTQSSSQYFCNCWWKWSGNVPSRVRPAFHISWTMILGVIVTGESQPSGSTVRANIDSTVGLVETRRTSGTCIFTLKTPNMGIHEIPIVFTNSPSSIWRVADESRR